MKRWKVVLCLVSIFVAGMLVGAAVAVRYTRDFFKPPKPEQMAQHMMQQFRSDLQLTEDQAKKIEPIVVSSTNEAEQLHHQLHTQFDAIFEKADHSIEEFLTPEQKVKFQEMKARRPKPPGEKDHK